MDVPPRSSRRNLPFLLGLVAVLALLPLGYFLFLHEPPAPPPAPPPVPVLPKTEAVKPSPPPVTHDPPVAPAPKAARAVELKIKSLEGRVEVRRAGGDWSPAQQNEVLRATDRVRTLEGSYAVIVNGEELEIHMKEGTEVSVEELTESISRLLLENGMTTVTTKPGTPLEMRAAGSEARVNTEGGRFTLSNDGRGTVALATLSGETRFSGPHNLIIVRAGQQSIVRPGQEPSLPTPIPTSLLLKVKWPARPQRRVNVSGETEPGALVMAGGQRVSADARGRFTLPLQLKEGTNPVKVLVNSVGGMSQHEQRELSVDTKAPKGVTVDPGLWGDP